MPNEIRGHDEKSQSLISLLSDTGYDARIAERAALPQSEILSDTEAIKALNEWLKQYYKVMVKPMDISALAHFIPNEQTSPFDKPTEFIGQDEQYRLLDLARHNITELIHEVCHIIIAEPHELREPDYGLTENRLNSLTEENEARTYVMQWYLSRQAGWENRTLETLPEYSRRYLRNNSWNGVDVDFAGKKELIEILKHIE